MKQLLIFILFTTSLNLFAEDPCKILKTCSEWATNKTGVKYDLGKLDKRSIKLEKDFNLNEGDPDFIFNYLLQSNDLVRIKRENGFQIVTMKEIKDFKFPSVLISEIPNSFDFYSAEFSLSNKEKVRNALLLIKNYLSKNGRVLEVADSPRVQVIDTGIHLNGIKLIINELNK
ncbi:MAG: hypothetical protein H7281_12930 [Bacteriovorax sp.]|nr:hypothetical protein [Bacteriovorax sp.]